MHQHKYKLIKQTSVLATNLNIYKCDCGKKKETYEPWGGKEKKIYTDGFNDGKKYARMTQHLI